MKGVHPMRRIFMLLALVIAQTVLTACGGLIASRDDAAVPVASIELDELPSGLGRGYPVALLNGIDNSAASLEPGSAAPNFQMKLEDGRALTLESLRGRPVLINFWATWCAPCRLEMPELIRQTEANAELVILAVNVMEDLPPVEAFVDDFQMPMPVVMDSSGDLRDAYLVRNMPTSIFIDREGNISTVWQGILTADLLEQMLEQIL